MSPAGFICSPHSALPIQCAPPPSVFFSASECDQSSVIVSLYGMHWRLIHSTTVHRNSTSIVILVFSSALPKTENEWLHPSLPGLSVAATLQTITPFKRFLISYFNRSSIEYASVVPYRWVVNLGIEYNDLAKSHCVKKLMVTHHMSLGNTGLTGKTSIIWRDLI